MKARKRLLAIIMAAVLAFGMTVPGFAVYGEGAEEASATETATAGISFVPENFPSEATASVGDSIAFSMDMTVTSPGALAVAAPTDIPADSEVVLWWYQDGVRRGDMGHTVIPAYALDGITPNRHPDLLSRHSGLDSESPAVRVELRFDTVWATDGGVWTLRAYGDGFQFVESPHSLDLTVAPIGIMPLSTIDISGLTVFQIQSDI